MNCDGCAVRWHEPDVHCSRRLCHMTFASKDLYVLHLDGKRCRLPSQIVSDDGNRMMAVRDGVWQEPWITGLSDRF